MAIVLTALLMLCNGENQCELEMKTCMKPFEKYKNSKVPEEIKSKVFQFCFNKQALREPSSIKK